jgi:hypothetical protein
MKFALTLFLTFLSYLAFCQTAEPECIVGDCQKGYGEKRYSNHLYKGEWKRGFKHGKGEIIRDDGGFEKGDFVKGYAWGYIEQFFGTTSEFAGDSYKGECFMDQYHGHGKYVFSKQGSSYIGDWKKGKMDGYGVYIYGTSDDSAGDKYEGYWKDGKQNGKGKFIYSNGTIVEGEFVNGVMQGEGKITLPGG